MGWLRLGKDGGYLPLKTVSGKRDLDTSDRFLPSAIDSATSRQI